MNLIRYTTLFLLFVASHVFSQTWQAIPAPIAEISCIKGDPHRPGMVWFVGHGVIAGTSDGGANWIYKSFSGYANLVPRDLLIDIADSTRWYMAVGAAGYMRSTDAGVSWEFVNENLFLKNWWHFKKMIQDKSEPNIMYLVSSERVYKSTDRGESWNSVLTKFRASGGEDEASVLLINHRNHDSLYVFASQSPVNRWVSGDQGITWEADSSSEIGTLDTYSLSDDGELLVGAWRSIDYGANWTKYKKLLGINKKPPYYDASSHDVSVFDAGTERYLLGCGSGLYWRKALEESWQPTSLSIETEGFYGRVHSLYYDAYNATLWGGHLSRIFKSTDGGNTIEYMESGPFLATTGYITTHNVKGGIVMGASVRTFDNGVHWECPVDGGSMSELFNVTQVAISPIDSMFIVRGFVPMSYTSSGWSDASNWKISNALYSAMPLRHRIQFNPHNPRELFGGTENGLWRVTDSIIVQPLEKPANFTEHIITPKWPDGTPKRGYTSTAMTFHPHQDGVYFLCTTELLQFDEPLATLWKTTDHGKSWFAILDRMSQYYYDICLNPQNPDIILIGSTNGVLRSVDGGKTWVQNYSPPFQAALIWSIIVDPRFPNVYYCGSESVTGYWTHWDTGLRSGGMYVSYDYGETWEALPLDGMHNVSVRFIHYHENPRRLIVSTWAGIYEMLLPEYTTSTTPVPESAALDVRVYPNPTTRASVQNIVINGTNGNHTVIDLYSIHGKRIARVHEGRIESGANLRQNIGDLPAGMYYYRVLAGAKQRTIPVVIGK